MTLIDIFNDLYVHTGTTEKKDAHRRGLWHRTFSALAITPATRRVLLQLKAPGRYSFDTHSSADFTVGGHYHAGEPIETVREVREELGLDVAYTDLHPLGIRQTAATLAPDYVEREFQHWHLLPLAGGIDTIPLDDPEVAGLVELGIDDAIRLAEGSAAEVPAVYGLRGLGRLDLTENTLNRSNLVPNYLNTDQIYLRMFVAARRYCSGEREHLFW